MRMHIYASVLYRGRASPGFSFPRKIRVRLVCFDLPFTPDTVTISRPCLREIVAHNRSKSAAKEESPVKVRPFACTQFRTGETRKEEGFSTTRPPTPAYLCPPLLPVCRANVPARHLDTVPVSLDWTAISLCTSVSWCSFFFLTTLARNRSTFLCFPLYQRDARSSTRFPVATPGRKIDDQFLRFASQ